MQISNFIVRIQWLPWLHFEIIHFFAVEQECPPGLTFFNECGNKCGCRSDGQIGRCTLKPCNSLNTSDQSKWTSSFLSLNKKITIATKKLKGKKTFFKNLTVNMRFYWFGVSFDVLKIQKNEKWNQIYIYILPHFSKNTIR